MNRTSRVKNVTIESSKSSSIEVRVASFSEPRVGAFGSCRTREEDEDVSKSFELDEEGCEERTGPRLLTKSLQSVATSSNSGSPSKKTPGISFCSRSNALESVTFCQVILDVLTFGSDDRRTSRGFRRMSA